MKYKFQHWLMSALLALSAPPLAAESPDWPLMPYPASVEVMEGELELRSGLAVGISGEAAGSVTDATLRRFAERFEQQTGLRVERHGREVAPVLTIQVEQRVPSVETLAEPLDPQWEGYQLRITETGIVLQANTQLGVQHGLETLLQLSGTEVAGHVRLPVGRIDDQPRFPWRGLMLDSVRHFLPVETIKRQLDGMAAAKLNLFHWHLTDDQGWRLESRAYPRLHQEASGGKYYTREEIREVVEYAAERGIQVMPEIDMPGHSSAIAVAYPELMSAPGPYEMEDRWGVHRPLLNPANERVYEFAEAILTEVAELFPFGYVHIGGDEVDPHDWNTNEEIQAFMQAQGLDDAEALHAYFNQRIADILNGLDRHMMGWDEVLHPDLPADTLVQSWRGPDALGKAAKQGHPAVLSTGFYLDQPQPAGYHYRNRLLPETKNDLRDSPQAGERWQTWSFEFPRKRGSAISGSLIIIQGDANEWRAFVDFDGKSRQPLQELTVRNSALRFQLDTWMGPVRGRLKLEPPALSGELIVGNAAYPVSGELLATSDDLAGHISESLPRPQLSQAEQQRILGGEIALWSELVNEQTIDLRLWPRAFVVAERLWSPATRRDEASLYQRLPQVTQWAQISVGLKHRHQQDAALHRLLPDALVPDVKRLSRALEPAQYYHRHHEKSVYETYSRRDPLNRFVDSLPAESLAVRRFSKQVDKWLAQPGSDALGKDIRQTLKEWRDTAGSILDKLDESSDPGHLRELAEQVRSTAEWGLVLADLWDAHRPLTPAMRNAARASLRQARSITAETVVAVAHPLERLLRHVPAPPDTQDYMPAESFTSGIEGPAIGPEGHLYAVNFKRQGTLGRITGRSQGDRFVNLPEGSIGNSIRFDADGNMWVADYTGHNLFKLDTQTGEHLDVFHNNAMHQPNDIAITKPGFVFATDPDWKNGTGQLWRLDPENGFTLVETEMGTTNGIELNPDESRLYVNESVQRRVWVYDLARDGSLSNKRLFYQFDRAGLDGMATDRAGNLYIARYGAGVIAILSPEGRMLETVQLKGRYPTNIALEQGDKPRAFVTLQKRGAIEVFPLSMDGG